MRTAASSVFLLSVTLFVCSSDLLSIGQAIASGVEVSISEKPSQELGPQRKISQKLNTEAQGEVVSRPLYLPGSGSIDQAHNVLPDADLVRSAGWVKAVTEKTDSLESVKSISEITKNALEVIAIIVGGFWTYTLFISQRQKYPRANLVHRITHRSLGKGKVLLNIDAILSNAGGVLIRVVSGELRIQCVLPLSPRVAGEIMNSDSSFPEQGREFSWDDLYHPLEWPAGPSEIEPGEENQFHYDCILPDATEVIKVYTYYKNEAKSGRDIGWNLTTVYDLRLMK